MSFHPVFAFIGLVVWTAVVWPMCSCDVMAADPPGDRKQHQVFNEIPNDLMLKYFQGLAESARGPTAPDDKAQWQRRRRQLRDRLWQSLGSFPLAHRPPLNAKVVGVLDHGDHVVEKTLYESLPGLYVTALLYRPKQQPKKHSPRLPAVICVNGHWQDAKTTEIIQRRCMALAQMGVIVFCQDVIGTGERQAFQGSPPQTYHGFYRGAAPRIVDRSLLGYIMYECIRAVDYLVSRPDVDPARIICTGASGGGKQSLFLPALDDRVAGSVPVCYVSSYQAHMGATACVGEIPTGILRYSNQWEILSLHAPRPVLCISATRDVPVFSPGHTRKTVEQAKQVYKLYQADDRVRAAEVDSKHDYNRPMRQLLYRFVSQHLLDGKRHDYEEPADLPVETYDRLRVGLPADSQTLQSLTYRRALEATGAARPAASRNAWTRRREQLLSRLKTDIFGGFPDRAACKNRLVRTITKNRRRFEHWELTPEPGVRLAAVLARSETSGPRSPVLLLVDEDGKKQLFENHLVEDLLAAGYRVCALDYRGAGETAQTVPSIAYGPGTPEYNLSNYGLFVGRPIMGMRVFDILCTIDFLIDHCKLIDREPRRGKLLLWGRGRGALAAVLAAAYDQRVDGVAAEELLASWVWEQEFVDIGLAYLIPRIVSIGDMDQLLAWAAPRPLLLLNPVNGRRQGVSQKAARDLNRKVRSVYQLFNEEKAFTLRRTKKEPSRAALLDWVKVVGQGSRP